MRKARAITLIALIITIIVLLIIAGITIAGLTNSGLFTKTQQASEKTRYAMAEEKVKLAVIASYGEDGKLNDDMLIKNINNIEGIDQKITTVMYDQKIKVDGYEFIITDKGNVTGTQRTEEGRTLIGQWMEKAGETGNKTLEEVLEDQELLNKLMNSEEAVNFMLDNQTILEAVLGNNNAIEALDQSNPKTVPTMTSYTEPSGEVFCSSEHSSNHLGWYAFKENVSSTYDWESINSGTLPQYIGYKFEEPVWIYKIYILNSNNSAPTKMILQRSDDGIVWEDVWDGFQYKNVKEESTNIVNTSYNNTRSKYWRLYITESQNSKYVDIWKIQFFGK